MLGVAQRVLQLHHFWSFYINIKLLNHMMLLLEQKMGPFLNIVIDYIRFHSIHLIGVECEAGIGEN